MKEIKAYIRENMASKVVKALVDEGCLDFSIDDKVAEVIRRAAFTGHAGDGMVVISSVDDAIRISTGDRGPGALSH